MKKVVKSRGGRRDKKTKAENVEKALPQKGPASIPNPAPGFPQNFREINAKQHNAELPGLSDFLTRLEQQQMGVPLRNYEWSFWTMHFCKLLSDSLSAVSKCVAPGVSQKELMSEAEEIFGKKIHDRFTDLIPNTAVRSLRNAVLKILVFLKRTSSAIDGKDEVLRGIRDEIQASLNLIEKWHAQPKARIERQNQRRRKKSQVRKYGSDFMDQCTELINSALEERYEHIYKTNCDPDAAFAPSIYRRTMPTSLFGLEHAEYEAWSKWIVDMLTHRAMQNDLCRETLRKRKQDIRDVLIPRLWGAVSEI